MLAPVALLVAYEAGWALFRRVGPAVAVVCGAGRRDRARAELRRRLHGARAAGDGVAADPAAGGARARARLRRAARPRPARLGRRRRASCSRSSTRPTRSSSGCPFARLPRRALARRAARGEADRGRARRARRPGGGLSRLAAAGRARHRARTRPAATSSQRAFRQYAGQLDVFSDTSYRLAPEVFGRAGRGRRGGAPLRPARRARAPAALGGVRPRRLPRGRRGDARADALRPLLRPRLDLAVAPRGRLLAARVRVRGRLRRARRRCCAASSCRRRSRAGSRCSSSTRASSPTGSRTAARRS